MNKAIFILIDGMGFEQAEKNLGFLEHLIEQGLGLKTKMRSELPSSSRPLYETLLTGLPVVKHGIVNNLVSKRSVNKSIFDLCREKGLTTAASAYYWISELYHKAPFDFFNDRINLNNDGIINHGIYYFEDFYPDSHVFTDAEYLRKNYKPDFLMVHSMNVDEAGHKKGSCSTDYEKAAMKLNIVISSALPAWMQEGYDVLITADHGMNEFGLHGGNSPEQRMVPFYLFSHQLKKCGDFSGDIISQLAIAPILCRLLGLDKPQDMKSLSEIEVDFFD